MRSPFSSPSEKLDRDISDEVTHQIPLEERFAVLTEEQEKQKEREEEELRKKGRQMYEEDRAEAERVKLENPGKTWLEELDEQDRIEDARPAPKTPGRLAGAWIEPEILHHAEDVHEKKQRLAQEDVRWEELQREAEDRARKGPEPSGTHEIGERLPSAEQILVEKLLANRRYRGMLRQVMEGLPEKWHGPKERDEPFYYRCDPREQLADAGLQGNLPEELEKTEKMISLLDGILEALAQKRPLTSEQREWIESEIKELAPWSEADIRVIFPEGTISHEQRMEDFRTAETLRNLLQDAEKAA